MKLVMDVHVDGDTTQAAAVSFDEWAAPEALKTWTSRLPLAEKPARGELDLRALPSLLQLLREQALQPELIVIDGFVHLDPDDTPGLGWHLHQALGGRCPVIGLSRRAMAAGTPAQFEVYREEEAAPVIVTCIGIDLGAAKARVRGMHGKRRMPTLMKLATRIAKNGPG